MFSQACMVFWITLILHKTGAIFSIKDGAVEYGQGIMKAYLPQTTYEQLFSPFSENLSNREVALDASAGV